MTASSINLLKSKACFALFQSRSNLRFKSKAVWGKWTNCNFRCRRLQNWCFWKASAVNHISCLLEKRHTIATLSTFLMFVVIKVAMLIFMLNKMLSVGTCCYEVIKHNSKTVININILIQDSLSLSPNALSSGCLMKISYNLLDPI